MPGAQYYDGKKLNIPISTEAGKEIYERWAFQSMSGLISSIANKRLLYFGKISLSQFHKRI